jgi:type II secretory pathway component PulL
MAYLDLPRIANWRSDFMPYQGRKLRLQNTMKFFSAAAVVLMLAVGLYGLMQAMQVNKYRARLREKFTKEYSAVMFSQQMPDKSKEAVRKLSAALRRIKDAQKGAFSLTGEDAVAGKLAMVLQAFNKCAADTGLNIDSVSISDKSITISGATSGPDNTLKVFEALKQAGLNVLQQRISSEGGRSTFNVVVEPKK